MNAEKVSFDLRRYLTIGCPSFIVVEGIVYMTVGGRTSVLLEEGVQYSKHGTFHIEHAKGSWAVLQHFTRGGYEKTIFIPPRYRLYASNGTFLSEPVNYESFLVAHKRGFLESPRTTTQYGCQFVWKPKIGKWKLSLNRNVLVTPASHLCEAWTVYTPSLRKENSIIGENARERAFSIAILYANQK